jgi:hypothetical protein
VKALVHSGLVWTKLLHEIAEIIKWLDTTGDGVGGLRIQGHNDNTQNPDLKPPSKQFLWLMNYISSTNRSSDLVGETSAQILPLDFNIFVRDLSAWVHHTHTHTHQPISQPTTSFEMIYLVSFIHAHSKPTNSNWKIDVEKLFNFVNYIRPPIQIRK